MLLVYTLFIKGPQSCLKKGRVFQIRLNAFAVILFHLHVCTRNAGFVG